MEVIHAEAVIVRDASIKLTDVGLADFGRILPVEEIRQENLENEFD